MEKNVISYINENVLCFSIKHYIVFYQTLTASSICLISCGNMEKKNLRSRSSLSNFFKLYYFLSYSRSNLGIALSEKHYIILFMKTALTLNTNNIERERNIDINK